jgi:hypothetical protein
MTDEDARKAQNAIRSIKAALTEGTLSGIETTAAIDGWLQLIKPELERRRSQLRGRR